jgi:uncharacterized protein (PEP-CTERM system associated)
MKWRIANGPRSTLGVLLLAVCGVATSQSLETQVPGANPVLPQLGSERDPNSAPSVLPGVRSSITYSNNLNLDSSTRSTNGTILEVTPYIRAKSDTPTMRYSIDYSMRNFLVLSPRNEDLRRQSLNSNFSAAVLERTIWFEGNAFIYNVTDDINRPISTDPGGYSANSSEVRGLRFGPVARGVLFGEFPYTGRYSFAKTSGGQLDTPTTHTLSGQIGGAEKSGRDWNWNWTGDWTRRINRGSPSRDRAYAAGSLQYQVTQDLRLAGGINFEQIEGYTSKGSKDYGYGPFATVSWKPIERFTFDADFGKRYYANVWQARAKYANGAFNLGFDASQSLQTSLDATTFLFDGLSLLGNTGSGANPIAAQLVQQNLINSFGIPFSAALISDAEVLTKRLNFSVGLVGARNSINMNATRTQRLSQGSTSLAQQGLRNSTRGIGLDSFGNAATSGSYFADLTTQAIYITYQHRFDARTNLDIAISRTGFMSPTIVPGDPRYGTVIDSISGGVSTKLTPDVTAGFGARHTRQRYRTNSNLGYDESAVFGTLDVRF